MDGIRTNKDCDGVCVLHTIQQIRLYGDGFYVRSLIRRTSLDRTTIHCLQADLYNHRISEASDFHI